METDPDTMPEEQDWRDGLAMDIEAPHCRDCDDYHWGPCRTSSDQLGDDRA